MTKRGKPARLAPGGDGGCHGLGWLARRKLGGAAFALRLAITAAFAAGFWPALAFSAHPAHSALAAQQQQEVSDSLQDAVRKRLELLTRRLGDSTGLIPPDSATDASALAAMASDSTLQALLALPGYNLIQYRGQSAVFETQARVLTLLGSDGTDAVLNREGMELVADSAMVFNQETGRLVTVGQEALYRPDQGDEVTTRQLIFDVGENRGTATDVRTRMSAGLGDWIVRGDFPSVSRDVSFGHDIMFTSCEEDEPHYHFVAREIKVTPGGTLVARNVLLYFADVGVFWLPFIAQSTQRGRRSGLLPLRFSVNDIVRASGSYSRRISNLGYYWAMTDYSDAEVGFDWWSGNYTAVTGGLRYRWLRQFLEGRANFRQFWRADGGSELAFDTNHDWEISERTQLRLSARYASSADFVRRNSFDPREVTQSIDSDGGLNRRFDWGNLSVSANRRQFLSGDRVEMTLPTANLSLSTITLFSAPLNRSRFYNNVTLSASGRFSRSLRDLPAPDADEPFAIGRADTENWRGGSSMSLSVGALSISQSVDWNRNTTKDIPAGYFDPASSAPAAGIGSVADLQRSVVFQQAADPSDFHADELTWSTSIDWQRNLVGSTTITPRLSVSGRSIRSDTTSAGGGGFIAAPRRLAFGAQLKSDIYGFYRGGTLRHKLTPTFEYAYSPETQPTELQAATFGGRAINPRNEVRIGLTQTFEAKKGDETQDSAAVAAADTASGPRRLQRQEIVTLLAVRTSAVTYDFEQADRLGHFTRGFGDNLQISHQISSDYLRGLSLSIEHRLFDDSEVTAEGGSRQFAPSMSSMNMSFSLNDQSSFFRWLRRTSSGEEEAADQEEDEPVESDSLAAGDDPAGFETADLGEATVVPGFGGDRDRDAERQRPRQGATGKWNASFSYSLARPFGDMAPAQQMLQVSSSFQPTEKWSVNWRTSYDMASGGFNDHIISLTRDLHRWEADFSFRQTATGNWSFMFEVALSDNRDLHFDYEQRAGSDFGRRQPLQLPR